MVAISKNTIAEVLLNVLSGNQSREEAASWALSVREGLESRTMSYNPFSDEERIWDAIIFLEGIDLMDSPTSYLHNNEDLSKFRSRLLY